MADTSEYERIKAPYKNGGAREPGRRFNLVPFDEIPLAATSYYLVKGLIPREGLIVVWGAPKCGKSFLVFDLLMHVALGWEYRGRRVKQGPIVYVACEGERGLGARAAAFRQVFLTDTTPAVPFYLITTRLNLPDEAGQLAENIREQIGQVMPVAIAIDTLNRSIAGSESKDEDMGAYIKATDRLRETFRCSVIVIHHCGVENNRPRGHTSLTGAADAMIAVKKDGAGTVTATVEMMKDGASGEIIASELRVVIVGSDEDGEDIKSCVVDPAEAPAAPAAEKPLSKNQQTMFSILHEAGTSGLTVEEWNERARTEGLGTKRKADLRDFRTALKGRGLVQEYGGRWAARR